jgi:hypothetical protein
MTEPSTVDLSAESPRYREAFNRLKGELRAIPADSLLTLNVEPPVAVTTTLRSLPAIKPLRSRLIAEFAKFDTESFDKLEDYAMALSHADTVVEAAAPDAVKFDALLQSCIKQRDVTDADLRGAVARGHINGERMKELQGGNGYRNVAHDLFILVQIARTDWPKLDGKTFMTKAELDRSERAAEDLTAAIAERERLPSKINEAVDDRQRAFTALARAHAKTRRAIQYLSEEHGDVDATIMPSFYNGRASGRGRPETDAGEPEEPPATTPDVSPAPVPTAPTGSGRIGMPDSDPFTS